MSGIFDKGSPLNPNRKQTKQVKRDGQGHQVIEKNETKNYNLPNASITVNKSKTQDATGIHKSKNVIKNYFNPLTNENVTVEKRKADGVKEKTVTRVSAPTVQPEKEAEEVNSKDTINKAGAAAGKIAAAKAAMKKQNKTAR